MALTEILTKERCGVTDQKLAVIDTDAKEESPSAASTPADNSNVMR